MVVKFQILLTKEKIENSISHHASKVLSFFIISMVLSDVSSSKMQPLFPQRTLIARRILHLQIYHMPTKSNRLLKAITSDTKVCFKYY